MRTARTPKNAHEAQLVAIESLKPYPGNARTHDLDVIRESLRVNTQYRPIVVRTRTRHVLAGNGTLEAAKAEGWAEIWATFIDCDAKAARRINLVDNRANDLAGWDEQLLAAQLGDLPGVEGTGWSERELVSFVARVNGPGEDTEPSEPPKVPRTKLGDLWVLDEHRLLCGDATLAEDVERLAASELVLVFTSPPYRKVRDYGGGDLDPARLAGFLSVWASGLYCVNLGILHADGAVVCYWDAYIEAADDAGLKLISWNVWNRGSPSTIAQQVAPFPIEHEFVFVFGSDAPRLAPTVPNKHAGERRSHSERGIRGNTDGRLRPNAHSIIRDYRNLGTVYSGGAHGGVDLGHPAVFPIHLPEAYISACTSAADVVADPFAGSGSTLIACENLSRRCYAMEIDPGYCDVIVDRWERHTGKKATRART